MGKMRGLLLSFLKILLSVATAARDLCDQLAGVPGLGVMGRVSRIINLPLEALQKMRDRYTQAQVRVQGVQSKAKTLMHSTRSQ